MKEKKPRRVNDLKGPRFRATEYTTTLVKRSLYEEWRKANKEFKHVKYSEFLQIWFQFTEMLMDYVAMDADGIRLPFYLGDIAQMYPHKTNERVNHVESQKVGHNVYERMTGKIVWSVEHARKKNKYITLYSFQPSRRFRDKGYGAFVKTPERFKDARLVKWQVMTKVKLTHGEFEQHKGDDIEHKEGS